MAKKNHNGNGCQVGGTWYPHVRQDRRGWYVYDNSLPRNRQVRRFGRDPAKAERRIIAWMRERAKRTGETLEFESSVSISLPVKHVLGGLQAAELESFPPVLGDAENMAEQVEQTRQHVESVIDAEFTPDEAERFKEELADDKYVVEIGTLSSAEFWQRVGSAIERQPRLWAKILKLPQIADLSLVESEPDLSLDAIIERWSTDSARPGQTEIRQTQSIWREFAKALGVDYIHDVDQESMDRLHDWLQNKVKSKEWNSWDSISRHLTRIKGVLTASKNKSRHCGRVLQLMEDTISRKKLQRRAKKNGKKDDTPKTVTPTWVKRMLEHCDDPLLECVIYLGLNCGYYLGEIESIPADGVDLDNATLDTHRYKTGKPKKSRLWGETVSAIKRWREVEGSAKVKHPEEGFLVYFHENGEFINRDKLFKRFDALRTTAGCRQYTSKHMRDSVETVPKRIARTYNETFIQDYLNTIMGHEVSQDESGTYTAVTVEDVEHMNEWLRDYFLCGKYGKIPSDDKPKGGRKKKAE